MAADPAQSGPEGAPGSDALKRAVLAVKDLRSRLEAVEDARREPLAVVGVGCRFPGGHGPDGYWRLLRAGIDEVKEIPPERWSLEEFYDPDPEAPGKTYARTGSFLDDVRGFDSHFFGISPREASSMDPQQRLLLEVSWEALEHGGISPASLEGSATGVFVGLGASDYATLLNRRPAEGIDPYSGTGGAACVAAGRLSYFLGLHGPNFAVDTACSSSLVAVHLACQSLRAKQCDLALAGGVSLILNPESTVYLSKVRALSAAGRCRTFDAGADGYVRGEGCGVVVLKRLADAQAAGDRILAVIRGSAINHDGRSGGLTVPNAAAQQAVVRAALEDARLDPASVGYVEAHGTGTELGDPIEVRALMAVLAEGRSAAKPVLLGSAKTNIGHLEAAAGVAGLIKVILSLERGEIPAHLHVQTPTPHVPWEQLPVRLVTELTPWDTADRPRVGGVSAFGFSGTNAHVLVQEAPAPDESVAAETERPQDLLVLSARGEKALHGLAGRYAERLSGVPPSEAAHVAHTAAVGRSHHEYRLATVFGRDEELGERLASFVSGEASPTVFSGHAADSPPPVAFLFTGQGAQHAGMGKELYETQPTFRRALERCADVLEPELDQPLLPLLFGEDAAALDETRYTQPALFALEWALSELWRSWGVEPQAVLGHSVGEYVAACVAGVMSLEDGLRLIARRGRLMQSLPPGGAMVAVEASEEQAREALREFETEVSLAAVNAPDSVVVSGRAEAVAAVASALEARGVATQALKVSHAFHSPLVEPILSEFSREASAATSSRPRLVLVSNLDGAVMTGNAVNAEYWTRHVRQTVRFADGVKTLWDRGYRTFIEIGPHPTLLGLAQRQLAGDSAAWLPSLRRNQGEWTTLLGSLARLYVTGADIDWAGFDRGYSRHRVSAPTYPFDRKAYWLEPASRGSRAAGAGVGGRSSGHALLGTRLQSPLSAVLFESALVSDDPGLLADHAFYGRTVFPAAGYVEVALAAWQEVNGPGPSRVELEIDMPLLLEAERRVRMQTILTPSGEGSSRVEVFSATDDDGEPTWHRHARGRVGPDDGVVASTPLSLEAVRGRCAAELDVDAYYSALSKAGVEYGPAFQWLRRVWSGRGEAIAELQAPAGSAVAGGGFVVHPGLLDGGLQLLGAALRERGDVDSAYMPVRLGGLSLFGGPAEVSVAHVQLREDSGGGELSAELRFCDEGGRVWLAVREIGLRRVSRSALERAAGDPVDDLLFRLEWREQALASETAEKKPAQAGGWLILDDGGEAGARLTESLRARGERAIRVRPSGAAVGLQEECDPLDVDGFQALLESAERGEESDGGVGLRGVVHLWGLDGPRGDGDPETPSVESAEALLRVGTGSLLSLTQALARRSETPLPRLFVATRGGQPVLSGSHRQSLTGAALWGLARTVAVEHPGLRPVRIDLDPSGDSADALWAEIEGGGDEDQVAYRGGTRYVARLARMPASAPSSSVSSPAEAVQLRVGERGGLDGLHLVGAARRPPDPGEVEIAVEASGLNFRDVLNALGMYPGDAGPLGNECSGRVTRVGADVTDLSEGDEVVALVPGAFASHVTTRAELVVPRPAGMNAAEAASVPIAFLTARYALERLAGVKAGQRVLIHAAAGGVGMAAVQLALAAGCEVFGTAGNDEKRALLRRLGVQHALDSRSVSFADEVRKKTGGRGVDFVLNSLSGELLERSLELVAPGGCFVEIGKRGIWSEEQVRDRFPEIRYHVFDLGDPLQAEPEQLMEMLQTLMAELVEGRLRPLPRIGFPLERAGDAFQHMARARHVGKIVLVSSKDASGQVPSINESASYLVTGGLGGLGLEVARWLVERGARDLVLVSRRPPSEAVRATLRALEEAGARVRVARVDVADGEAVGRLVSELRDRDDVPLRGVIHAAGALDDGMLAGQDWSRFERVLAPKVRGALVLDEQTRDLDLDFFVLFSSVASLLGSPGQGNYAAANAFLDGLAHDLRARGRPALSINWGPWARVGMAARLGEADQARRAAQGVELLEPKEGCLALERLLASGLAQCAAMPADWRRFTAQFPEGAMRGLFEELSSPAPRSASGGHEGMAPGGLARRIEVAPAEAQSTLVQEYLRDQVVRVLGLDPAQPPGVDDGLAALGMDSLMAVELRNRVEADAGIALPVAAFLGEATLERMAGELLGGLGRTPPSEEGAASPGSEGADLDAERAAALLERIDDMPEDEVDRLLGQMADEGPAE